MTGIRRKRNSMSWFQTEKGILYRVFQSPRVNEGKSAKQVVLPRVLRAQVTALAHELMIEEDIWEQRKLKIKC